MFDTKILGTDEDSIAYAAKLLSQGEVVGMPTETVYGLAANAFDEAAVRKIFAAKGLWNRALCIRLSRAFISFPS